MKKFLLVVFIGMVLAIDIYGVTMELIDILTVEETENDLSGVATIVYEE